ncbi:ABC transporter ATP-binding protein [Echinicola strongylocentroti]|uniref:ABC transporter ATP-binding protein n=1 Tax=Echinicola strongylocentroti TaxID=1795355 RepID=A0A2Z4IDR5_9BACT|nr:ABC transporter ATP-binding protein [Echinicola strongylocentroti]AWW29034.1 ABC transporter ATP-binding protein [Echinicola strongylocentroti]
MILLNQMSFAYRKQAPLFDQMDWEVQPGQVIGLLGKNGAGKSTLMGLLAGLLKPTSGDIQVNGYRPFGRSPLFLQELILLPEENFLPEKNTIQRYIGSLAPFYPRFDREKMNQLQKDFDLPYDQKLGSMSFGQRKKFLIAFAIASGCKLLLLDEPTNGLDIPSKSLFRKIVTANIEEDQTVIISTHQVKDVENLIDRAVIVNHGKVIFDEEMLSISDQWYFGFGPQADEHSVYVEKSMGGYHYVAPLKSAQQPSQISLELLFNAVINDRIRTPNTINA